MRSLGKVKTKTTRSEVVRARRNVNRADMLKTLYSRDIEARVINGASPVCKWLLQRGQTCGNRFGGGGIKQSTTGYGQLGGTEMTAVSEDGTGIR